jgi:hypothetical protein
MPFGKPACLFVWQGSQREARHHPHFLGSKVRLNPLEHVSHKAVPERNRLFRLPVCGCLFRFPLQPLFFLLSLLAKVDFARPVCAYLHESTFL